LDGCSSVSWKEAKDATEWRRTKIREPRKIAELFGKIAEHFGKIAELFGKIAELFGKIAEHVER